MAKITNVLRDLREKHRKTQESMGAKLGISQSQYNKIEKGEKPLEFNMLVAIARIFNIEAKQLFAAIFEEDENANKRIVVFDGTVSNKKDEDNHYKKMADYFEEKFLNTYRLYIELQNRYNIEMPMNAVGTR
ncbi:MAG: hypothetical protein BGO69_04795 [Bacteroidetes bacterium 46-16]|nr:MAG: hypothetical protein BGO69_04795 [Bacteroidetes bacterium 46-16]